MQVNIYACTCKWNNYRCHFLCVHKTLKKKHYPLLLHTNAASHRQQFFGTSKRGMSSGQDKRTVCCNFIECCFRHWKGQSKDIWKWILWGFPFVCFVCLSLCRSFSLSLSLFFSMHWTALWYGHIFMGLMKNLNIEERLPFSRKGKYLSQWC